MQKNLLLLVLVAFLSNCTQTTVSPVAVDTTTVDKSGTRKPYTETIVILGSSTAEGWGASEYRNSWAGLLTKRFSIGRVVNLAKGGYNSYQILPTHSSHPANRPAADTLRNLTAALKEKPTTLIISITTNDVLFGYGVDEIITNFNIVRNKALAAGVARVLITTPIPRKLNAAATAKYLLQRDLVLKNYGTSAVNIFDPVANSENLFKSELLCGDGIHPNDKGHKVIYEQIKKVLLMNLLR
ncbi:SGNH/GDSL hydrolase family protein [Spirosoma pulveris]